MTILLLNDYGVLAGVSECIVLSLRDELRRLGHDARLFMSTAATCAPRWRSPTHGLHGRCDGPWPIVAPMWSTSIFTSRNSRR